VQQQTDITEKIFIDVAELMKRPLGRRRRRWEDGIKMDLKEIGWGGVWIGFTWLRIGIFGGML
jgi:hypothetical protein